MPSLKLLKYLARNLSEDDVRDLCDHVDRVLDADDVTNKIRNSTELSYMLRVLLDFLWRQDGTTLALLFKHIQQDYNFVASRIKEEYQRSQNVNMDRQQDQSGVHLMLVSRPTGYLNCHPIRLSVPPQHHEQWDHVVTFAYTALRTSKLDYCIKAELSGVVSENGDVIRVPLESAVPVFRCAEKCRTVSSEGTVPQISLWCRFKGYKARTTQTVNFVLHATSGDATSIECASVCVDFKVKMKRKQAKKVRSSKRKPSKKLTVLKCTELGKSSGTSSRSVTSTDASQSTNEGHTTAWSSEPEAANAPNTSTDLVPRNFQGEQRLLQPLHSMPKLKAFVYDRDFGADALMSMFRMFVGLMNSPQEFDRRARNMKQFFSNTMPYSDMRIILQILESTQAYAYAGEVEKSYRGNMRAKRQLVPRARNPAVVLAEINIQLVVVYRRLKKFGLAERMIEEAHQALSDTELCQTHGRLCKCEATLYMLMLQNSPVPNQSLRKRAIDLFRKAIDILHQTDNFLATPEHHIKDCYVQLAEVYVNIHSSDIRYWTPVSEDDIREAELCLQKAQQMIRADFYGRGGSKLKLTQAKLLIRKGQLAEAAERLKEGIRIAQTSGAQVDAQYCEELLQSIENSPEFTLQKMKLAATDGGGEDSEDGDADTNPTSAYGTDSCENDCDEM